MPGAHYDAPEPPKVDVDRVPKKWQDHYGPDRR